MHLITFSIDRMTYRVGLPFYCHTSLPSCFPSVQPIFITETKEQKVPSKNQLHSPLKQYENIEFQEGVTTMF
jgi:hypothetical protein